MIDGASVSLIIRLGHGGKAWLKPVLAGGVAGGKEMIEALMARVNGDEALVRRGRFLTTTFLLEIGRSAWLISIFEGRIVSAAPGPLIMPSSSRRHHHE